MENNYYCQTIEGSQYYDDLNQIKRSLDNFKFNIPYSSFEELDTDISYIIKGVENTIKKYELKEIK